MRLNIEAVSNVLKGKGWSEVMFARKLGLDYSYVYRIMRGERGIGNKFLTQFIKFCENEKLPFRSYIEL